MKTRESGMPEESMWEGFFTPDLTLKNLGLSPQAGDVADFGCGYGTFSVAAARITTGVVHAIDIDPAMVEATRAKAAAASLGNVKVELRDFVAEGAGLPAASVGYAMLFNILHAEAPGVLLREAWRVLRPGGGLGLMHWRYDPSTPRGPSMAIRPRLEQLITWAEAAGFRLSGEGVIDLPPYHYGALCLKPSP
jgi:SAM-dependent methyltransferase